MIQLDFRAAFDKVSHDGFLFKLQYIEVGGAFPSIIGEILSGNSQVVVVDVSSSARVDVISGVPQGSVLGSLLFLVYTSELFSLFNNILVGYADDTTLLGVVPRPSNRTDFLNAEVAVISDWCLRRGKKLNAKKKRQGLGRSTLNF